MAKPIHQTRLNHLGEFDSRGRLFVCPSSARITDLSGVRLLGCHVDTVRQLYRGVLRPQVLSLFAIPVLVLLLFRAHSTIGSLRKQVAQLQLQAAVGKRPKADRFSFWRGSRPTDCR